MPGQNEGEALPVRVAAVLFEIAEWIANKEGHKNLDICVEKE